jgi:hypothetical protein
LHRPKAGVFRLDVPEQSIASGVAGPDARSRRGSWCRSWASWPASIPGDTHVDSATIKYGNGYPRRNIVEAATQRLDEVLDFASRGPGEFGEHGRFRQAALRPT